MLKDANPGCYDLSFGGVFAPDESHHLNASRELKEELNLPTIGDEFTFSFAGIKSYQDAWTSQFAYMFVMRIYDESVLKELKLQESEVESVEWWSVPDIFEKVKMQ